MKNLNSDEKKATGYINQLREALEDNKEYMMKNLDSTRQEIDWSNVRQSILDEVDELYEHKNYSE